MATKNKRPAAPPRKPPRVDVRGSAELTGDLEKARAELTRELEESTARTAAQLAKE